MRIRFPRQVGTCPSGKEYFTCSVGDFRGCCSTNPCDTGKCSDDGSNSSGSSGSSSQNGSQSSIAASNLQSATQAVSTQISSNTASAAQSTAKSTGSPGSSSASNSATKTSATGTLHLSASSTSPSTSTATPSSIQPSHSSHKRPAIGGIVGGLGLAALLAALLYLCCRRGAKLRLKLQKKKEEKEEEKGKNGDAEEIAATGGFSNIGVDRSTSFEGARDPFAEFGGHFRGPDQRHPAYMSGPDQLRESISTAKSDSTAVTASGNQQDEKKALDSLTSHTSGRISASTTIPSSNSEPDPAPHLDGNSIVPSLELPASIPPRAGFTAELSDQYAPRPRAELSANPEHNPINMPKTQRTTMSSGISNNNDTVRSVSTSTTSIVQSSPSSITSDGAIMRSNLNSSIRSQNRRAKTSNASGHVTSFMEYHGTNEWESSSTPSAGLKGSQESRLRDWGSTNSSPTLPNQVFRDGTAGEGKQEGHQAGVNMLVETLGR